MSLDKDDEPPGDARECPVCYESPRGTERTLSCGHAFCHDCLVKLLLSVQVEGQTRHTLACPVCRHLTFIKKRQSEPPAWAEGRGEPEEDPERGGQTLEVPAGTPLTRLDEDGAAAAPASFSGRLRRFFCGDGEGLLWPSPCSSSEVFVIGARGRPMTEDDAFGAAPTAVRPPRRRRRRPCSTARCLAVLLSAFTTMALVAAVLPWILLA
ncbi:RING finger protein 222 [Hippocampus zosterae]|uniref:RING finger protein 222 n=1 Tax=Hippocampus zosterae TaxID=109293 RepID=UPI00223CED6B|nr:RING finger protein 222 [Hippocampus zosterae]